MRTEINKLCKHVEAIKRLKQDIEACIQQLPTIDQNDLPRAKKEIEQKIKALKLQALHAAYYLYYMRYVSKDAKNFEMHFLNHPDSARNPEETLGDLLNELEELAHRWQPLTKEEQDAQQASQGRLAAWYGALSSPASRAAIATTRAWRGVSTNNFADFHGLPDYTVQAIQYGTSISREELDSRIALCALLQNLLHEKPSGENYLRVYSLFVALGLAEHHRLPKPRQDITGIDHSTNMTVWQEWNRNDPRIPSELLQVQDRSFEPWPRVVAEKIFGGKGWTAAITATVVTFMLEFFVLLTATAITLPFMRFVAFGGLYRNLTQLVDYVAEIPTGSFLPDAIEDTGNQVANDLYYGSSTVAATMVGLIFFVLISNILRTPVSRTEKRTYVAYNTHNGNVGPTDPQSTQITEMPRAVEYVMPPRAADSDSESESVNGDSDSIPGQLAELEEGSPSHPHEPELLFQEPVMLDSIPLSAESVEALSLGGAGDTTPAHAASFDLQALINAARRAANDTTKDNVSLLNGAKALADALENIMQAQDIEPAQKAYVEQLLATTRATIAAAELVNPTQLNGNGLRTAALGVIDALDKLIERKPTATSITVGDLRNMPMWNVLGDDREKAMAEIAARGKAKGKNKAKETRTVGGVEYQSIPEGAPRTASSTSLPTPQEDTYHGGPDNESSSSVHSGPPSPRSGNRSE